MSQGSLSCFGPNSWVARIPRVAPVENRNFRESVMLEAEIFVRRKSQGPESCFGRISKLKSGIPAFSLVIPFRPVYHTWWVDASTT
jgi:hypothetical protein